MTVPGYKVRKAAQVVAFFAKKEGGRINVLKLIKLVYLADRESLQKYDYPILFDQMVAMDHGPVNSSTLNYINGYCESPEWDDFILSKNNYAIGLKNPKISIDDLDELSDADIAVLEHIWHSFGHMDKYEIRDYTHDYCPEWENPNGSSKPIPYERILKFLGKRSAPMLAECLQEDRKLYSF